MESVLPINFRQPISLFPIPGCVLLPHTAQPLHVFEPRYRRMVDDALDAHGLIAIALFDGWVTQEEYWNGHPPLRPCVGIGYITGYEMLNNRRYLLLLQGVARARIVTEVANEPYRLALLRPIDIEHHAEETLVNERSRFVNLMELPGIRQRDGVDDLRGKLADDCPTGPWIDMALQVLCTDSEELYQMLEEPSVRCRAGFLINHLQIIEGESGPGAD